MEETLVTLDQYAQQQAYLQTHSTFERDEHLEGLQNVVTFWESHLQYAQRNLAVGNLDNTTFWQDVVIRQEGRVVAAKQALHNAVYGHDFPVPYELGPPKNGVDVLVFIEHPDGRQEKALTRHYFGEFACDHAQYVKFWQYVPAHPKL